MQGQPIPFISIEEVERDGEMVPLFQVTPQAIKFLSDLKDKRVAVLVIAGPQRTGGREDLQLDPPLTHVLRGYGCGTNQLYQIPRLILYYQIRRDFIQSVLYNIIQQIIIERDINIDIKIFSISILLSSMFVFNQLGHIDEQSIDNLSLVVNLSENISAGQEGQGISQFFPQFLWVLRDFSLDLQGKSSREYLEFALSNQQGGPEAQKKNIIRSKIREYFQQRDCICMVRPLDDESQLARIEDQEWNTLRPEFIKGVQEFEKRVRGIQPKQINGVFITSEMFVKLTLEYVDAINSGGVPQVLTSLDRVMQQEARSLLEDLKSLYKQRIDELLAQKGKGPWDDDEIQAAFKLTSTLIYEKLEQQTTSLVDVGQIMNMRRELTLMMDKDYQQRIDYNKDAGALISQQLVTRFINTYQQPIIENVEGIRDGLLRDKFAEYGRFYTYYIQNAKGNHKCITIIYIQYYQLLIIRQVPSRKDPFIPIWVL